MFLLYLSLLFCFTGKQSIPASGPEGLVRGKSVTDACINWDTTVTALNKLCEAVRARREATKSHGGIKVKVLNGHYNPTVPEVKIAKGFNDDAIALFASRTSSRQ